MKTFDHCPGRVGDDESEPRFLVILRDDLPSGPLDQAALGVGGDAVPDHDDRFPTNTVEERQRMHRFYASHSGTRSAARIVAGSIRSATTAHLSPSTMTSGTSARLL